AALAGLVIAAGGVALHQATGHRAFDSIASISIGLLLTVVAFVLAKENRSLIVGEAADPRLQRSVEELISSYGEVTRVEELLTMVVGRGEIFVAARLDLDDTLSAAQVEETARRMEAQMQAEHPTVRHFFVDVTADSLSEGPSD